MLSATSQSSKHKKHKRARLVINPRDGQNVTNITAMVAVVSAAGWKTDIALKEYGGQSMELATRAAEEGYDLVLSYGGDGIIDIGVIKPGNPLTGIEQICSFLFRRLPDHVSTEYFHGPSIVISVPASIEFQLDGSPMQLKDYLNKTDRQALRKASNDQEVMVNYRFVALPRAIQIAIPRAYQGGLFRQPPAEEPHPQASQQRNGPHGHVQDYAGENAQRESPERINTLLEQGHHVTVTGVLPQPDEEHGYIIAGTVQKRDGGDSQPVAVQVIDHTCILRHTGEQVAPATFQDLHEGAAIVVVGKKSKRNVILATHVLI